MTKPERHAKLCDELNRLYCKKNADYDDAIHKGFALNVLSDELKEIQRGQDWAMQYNHPDQYRLYGTRKVALLRFAKAIGVIDDYEQEGIIQNEA